MNSNSPNIWFVFVAEDLETVQKEVDEMFKGRILVGHAITNDEKVLILKIHRTVCDIVCWI